MSEQEQQAILLEIRKLYVDDISVEVPNAPHVFQEELSPEISLGVTHEIEELKEEGYYAVKLRLTVTAKDEKTEKSIYLTEVQQSGVFEIQGLEPAQLHHALNVYCPTTLYPYAREVISSAINRAGFPPLYLQPVNFDAIYQHKLQQAQQESAQSGQA
ncbi:protein-export chaperone SecB [Suttonella ornithocola]|uniref:Protein-export protein SecB n=1 Tax=Suttonella ornithocola TaxID=279832 RepID=A0A380MQJ1_9GAMM|nr:protein-export chaperone SecB [Suttonella ornithocola]SUO94558.1 Protein-export protein SecB [Suttonella ornithocola]